MKYAMSQLLLAATEEGAEHAEEPSGLDLLIPPVEELIWGIVAFAVVYFVLNKFAFPALRKNMEERDRKIQEDLEQAENAKQEGQRQLDEYRKQLAAARGEANKIIAETSEERRVG